MMKRIYSKVLFLIIVFTALAAGLIFLNIKKSQDSEEMADKLNFNELKAGEPIDISDTPIMKLIEDHWQVFYIDNGVKRKVVRNSHPINQLHFSPLNNKFGYIENFDLSDQATPYNRQVILHIGETKTKETKEVYQGSFKTSGWEWFGNDEVLVSYGCGTECQALIFIDMETGQRYELQYGVGYEWSPDKNMVLAFHYTVGPGITVGDKFGKELFNLQRERLSGGDKLIDMTAAEWSPDSAKVALVMRKANKNALELLVFDVSKKFKQIFQSDVGFSGFSKEQELFWSSDSQKVTLNNVEFFIR